MMKQVLLVAALAMLATVVLAESSFLEVEKDCHPQCRWQCDDPVCPAKCHPVCERPKCQIQCEETACAKCKVHCDKPQCNVRCPKDMCEKKDCPKCETVCSPANCRTSCVAPEPVCTPMCEETKCDWKCKKPTTCPKPKCELQCDKPACAAKPPAPRRVKRTCCSCSAKNVKHSMLQASERLGERYAEVSHALPSFIEVMHAMKHMSNMGAEGCCECANRD
jgi:hypothetical protein